MPDKLPPILHAELIETNLIVAEVMMNPVDEDAPGRLEQSNTFLKPLLAPYSPFFNAAPCVRNPEVLVNAVRGVGNDEISTIVWQSLKEMQHIVASNFAHHATL